MSFLIPEQLDNFVEFVKQHQNEPTTITLTIELRRQEGNKYYEAICLEEPGIGGFDKTKRKTLADLLKVLGMYLAGDHQAMELDRILEEGE